MIIGKDKDDVSLKRARSNSIANNVAQRVPLGPGRGQVAPPVTTSAPIRAVPRLSRPSTSNFNGPRRLVRDVPRPIPVYEDDVDMDVEEPVVPPSEDLESPEYVEEAFLISELDGHDMVVEEEEEEEEEVTETVAPQEPKAPKVWPDLATEHRLECQKRVDTIREVFQDDDEEFDPTMVSEYAEEIFEYMSELEVCTELSSCRCVFLSVLYRRG